MKAVNMNPPQLNPTHTTRQQRLKMEYPSADEGNFGFGFNHMAFSDRVLRLEITPALPSDMNSGGKKYLNWFSSLDANHSECGPDLKVKKLHINSLVLASKSTFFYKLFTNGMKESQKRDDVTLRINASEEATLMDLLNFIYGNTLSATSIPDLVDVMMAADKFVVISCIRHCVGLLLNLPMSTESVVFYMELPSTILESGVVQPLIDTSKQYLADHYRAFTDMNVEAMALPLSAIEVLFGSDGLIVDSEDDVFDFMLKWSRLHHPKLEERREILMKHLVHFICFPNMSSLKSKEVLDCSDFNYEEVVKLVLKALFSKVEHNHNSKDVATTRRVYSISPIKVVAFEFLPPRCVVYLDLKKDECKDLFPSKRLYSPAFCLGGRDFLLSADCHQEKSSSVHYFGLFVEMKGSESWELDYDFAAMKKPSKEFEIQGTIHKSTFTDRQNGWGSWLFKWTHLMNDESVYFIDGILHLRAQIAINN